MSTAIPYLVKKGDTLESISSELGIKDSYDLRAYHNMNSEVRDGIGADAVEGQTLLTPPKEKVDAMNAKRADSEEKDKAESDKMEEEKEEEEKKKEEEEKKEAAKSEHDDKYFVVHKAECACNKAENPKQTAKLLVTSHNKVVLNDQDGKFFATEADKTFDPPASTFGKCKLQPSSNGYLPCTLAPAPKWSKVYEKTQVLRNKVLTEISTLQCTIGGKIEIVKHGQTDSIMKEHADNTNPAALALINPAVKMPVLETAYPSVSAITLKSLENEANFKPVSSSEGKKVEQVLVRPNTECTFEAKIKKGNVALSSWVIYDGHTGDKDKKLLTSEQVGTSFKNSFPVLGKYRVEGYGKPKREDFEKGKFDKNYPDCSIDIEVTNNKLVGDELLPIDGENFAKKVGGKMRLRQNFPASFKAKFLMVPTDEELEGLRLYVTDASGNVIKSVKVDYTVSFTPINTKAQYKIVAEYKLPSGEIQVQSFSAETMSNSVSSIITHNAEVIRPGTPMSFSVKEGDFSFYVPNDEAADAAINKEFEQVKWNLNGRLIGTGKSITIPGHEFVHKDKYVVEAYMLKANAYGSNAKDEADDWRFEVKDNDVMSFSYIEVAKVGKTTKLIANSFVFQKALDAEHIIWKTAIPHKTIDKKTISITPAIAGKQNVQCAINREPGITLGIDVKQGKVLGMLFTDSNGIEIQKASWGQKINIWVQQQHLTDEDIIVEVWDNDTFDGDDNVAVINKNKYDGGLISFVLDTSVKQKTGDQGKLYVRIGAPKLKLANTNAIFESKNHLDVQDKREIYGAHIGSQDGKERHYMADYDKISYFYAKSRGIKKEEQLNLTIYEKDKKLLEATNVHVDESGMIKIKLEWNLINPKLPMRMVYAIVKDKDENILFNGIRAITSHIVITKKSALLSLAEYKSAVLVGNEDANGSKKDNKNGVCECEAKVRAFMRMLRVGEGTENEIGYETIVGGSTFKDHGKNFDNHPNVYIKKHDSRAAGAYQITMNNWNDVAFVDWRKEHGLNDFKPESQDKYCVYLIKEKKKALGLIKKNNIKEAIDKCRTEWASLPGAGYGQREEDIDNILKKYKQYYQEELKGPTNHLHIKKGFLKEFGEECCEEENIVVGVINKYRIDVDVFAYSKIMKCLTSNKYQYDIYESNKLIKTITVEKNEHNLLPFPETGINWGRFGPRDKGGDNWVNEKVCAALLGFFFSLPKNGYSEALYFNDISANDGRDIGHKGHNIAGNDIDIRYPGSSNAGRTLWSDAMNKYKTEEEFVKVLENIISVGVKWGFNKNYAYKKDIKNTTGKSTSVHQDHFHLGLR
nr:PAAR-like protein [uncultured Flavobacterium sp.]